ncbi:hypothetical protein [Phaeovulum sp.]|jgi:heme exporter protein D|uniref:hypothetical protein n=1 Tax=Phaeovulum sp. TaxID=2934796 RepID=UPI00272F43EF|nr:hypothetical protein [Phaeovulum sp.]MDP1668654.1 hypothetical protein [Phaeovulum sp.]MDP2061578.1 hypothetical protein [Phaeovulum sp.]MDP3861266.1 hypothetical protein [Phaeovulum sp.]MDZ4119858.1 hypothetical protein [Phaeovulum sp.]
MGHRSFWAWAVVTAALVLLAVAIPYRVLAGGAPSLAIFGFWSAFGVAVIAMIGLAVMRWKD